MNERRTHKKQVDRFPVSDLYLYFDGVQCDGMQLSQKQRRWAEIVLLRDRLVSLDDDKFAAIMAQMQAMVREAPAKDQDKGKTKEATRSLLSGS